MAGAAPRRRRFTRLWNLPPMSGGCEAAPQGPSPRLKPTQHRAAGMIQRAGQQVILCHGTQASESAEANTVCVDTSFNLGVCVTTLSFTTGPATAA